MEKNIDPNIEHRPGILRDHNVLESWTRKVTEFARTRPAESDRNFVPCDKCDIKGTMLGEEHFKAWEAKQSAS